MTITYQKIIPVKWLKAFLLRLDTKQACLLQEEKNTNKEVRCEIEEKNYNYF